VIALPYSSGTTGLSKGVMLSHRNLVANVAQTLGGANVREDEKFIAFLPFFHIYGMQVLMNTGLRAGATVITMPRFELEDFLRLHQEYGITRSFVAPLFTAGYGERWSARSAVECGGSKGTAVRIEMRGAGEVGGGARRAQPIGPRVDRMAESGAARRQVHRREKRKE